VPGHDERQTRNAEPGDERRPAEHQQLLPEQAEQPGDRVVRARRHDGEEVAVDELAAQHAHRLCGRRALIKKIGAAIEVAKPVPRGDRQDDCGPDPFEASATLPGRKSDHNRAHYM
jgi:hypothetical protein